MVKGGLRVKVSPRLLGELESAGVRLQSDAANLVASVRALREAASRVVSEVAADAGSDPELEMVLEHDVV